MTTPLTSLGDEPTGPDPSRSPRPWALAIAGLALAVLGFIAAAVAMAPALGVPMVIGAAVLLVAGLVLAILSLATGAGRKPGLGIAALVVAVSGGILCVISLVVSLIFLGLPETAAPAQPPMVQTTTTPAPETAEPDTTPSTDPTQAVPAEPDDPQAGDDATDTSEGQSDPGETDGEDAEDGTDVADPPGYDQSAYLAEVRPQVRSILKEVRPDADDATIDKAYSDDMLLSLGQAVLTTDQAGGQKAVDQQVQSMVDASNGMFDTDQAQRFVAAVLTAAQDHLQR